jgi:sorbitol/mannitol transport system substrate-binding protein
VRGPLWRKLGRPEARVVGVQYVGIPEFEDLGTRVSQEITAAIVGQQSVDQALSKAQGYAATVGKTYQN